MASIVLLIDFNLSDYYNKLEELDKYLNLGYKVDNCASPHCSSSDSGNTYGSQTNRGRLVYVLNNDHDKD